MGRRGEARVPKYSGHIPKDFKGQETQTHLSVLTCLKMHTFIKKAKNEADVKSSATQIGTINEEGTDSTLVTYTKFCVAYWLVTEAS